MLSSKNSAPGSRNLIAANDTVIAVLGDVARAVKIQDAKFSNMAGTYCPKDWVGLPYGSCVYPSLGYNDIHKVWPLYLLAPSPELWTKVLKHRTQILYLPDISLVCAFLELRPGCIVLESGTGSGSMSHSLARAVYPSGHLFTYEYHEERSNLARDDFIANGMDSVVTVASRNIEEQGFPESLHDMADAVFLDLPGPWKAVESATKCLKGNGRFCSFSPCIEQIQKTSEELRKHGFISLRTMECLSREHSVSKETLIVDLEAYQSSQEALRAARIQSKKRSRNLSQRKDDDGLADTECATDLKEVEDAKGAKDLLDADEQEASAKAGRVETEGSTNICTGPTFVVPRVSSMKGHTGYLIFARKFRS